MSCLTGHACGSSACSTDQAPSRHRPARQDSYYRCGTEASTPLAELGKTRCACVNHGPWVGPGAQGHSRPPDRRSPRSPPPRRPDGSLTAAGQDAPGREGAGPIQAVPDALDRDGAAGHGGDGPGSHRRQGVKPAPRHQHRNRRRGRALHPGRATSGPRYQKGIGSAESGQAKRAKRGLSPSSPAAGLVG